MPRNGDGSSDNGPIDAGEIVHGASGDATLQHTQKVAPMPEGEKGAAIDGMNASGGGSAGTSQGAHAQDSNKPPVVDQATKS
ncbi:hypothetical protein DPSP01_008335 [Paraphaeosphaeria sporulosa]|uniref:Uncharacterized protein n=1 Tax=Paraphaeosphaeria sporulosa TaxID=1460663 RepID=A0A177CL48_9PLEO|nr:uncharacterized protein CC84DRAFT_1214572 [Paraphaeosphaeria sporulosa]OAG08026.1 hypothetical protein CC84DRAFT_1214572 [Paraphaeosphaeria sporulosa]